MSYLLPTREAANESEVKQGENLQASSSEELHVWTTTTAQL